MRVFASVLLVSVMVSAAFGQSAYRKKVWSSGETVLMVQLNTEFDNLINAVNSVEVTFTTLSWSLAGSYLGLHDKADDSDKLDGVHGSGYSLSGHNHDLSYLGIHAEADDSVKLAGNVAASYTPSKATIEALLTGDISSHSHSAYLPVAGRSVDSEKLAGNLPATYIPSKATIEVLLTGTISSHNHSGTYLPLAGLAADSAKLAGNTPDTYGNSKSTIEALLTGQINSHTHHADHISGGPLSNSLLPATINATTDVQVGGTGVAQKRTFVDTATIKWTTNETGVINARAVLQ